jgi:hypothetical protein
MDLKLSINADFEKASKAFNDLANSSETTRQKIEKFSSSFQAEHINKFIDRQKLLETSLAGTRGEVAAMTTAQNNYSKEIERLIRSGLDPESDAIKKLRDEHDSLVVKIKETNEAQRAQEQAMKGAEKAALALFAAIGAGIAAVGVATQKTAEAGDQFAKTARVIGMTAEAFQELDYAAKMSGVDNLKGSLEKLNKSMSDLKDGSGTLTSYLKQNNSQLLNQLKNVNSNEDAFSLLMDAINKAPNEFNRAALAQAAFGKSGQEMILLAGEGADGIAKLREEARKYGVISNEAAANSEAYLDAQARLKAAIAGVANELTAGLLPGLTDTITGMADFIAGIDDWEGILTAVGIALVSVTAAVTAFVVASKGAAIVEAMAGAIKTLSIALTTGPAGAIALAVGAVAVAVGVFTTQAEKAAHAGERFAEAARKTTGEAEALLTDWQALNGEKALDEQTSTRLLALYPGLAEKMDINTASAQDLLLAIKELNRENAARAAQEWIDKLQKQEEQLRKAEEAQRKYTEGARENIRIALDMGDLMKAKEFEEAIDVYASATDDLRKKVANSVTQANAILSTVGQKLGSNGAIIDIPIEIKEPELKKTEKTISAVADDIKKTFQQKLSDISLTPEQQLNEQINTAKSFLEQRANLERAFGEERIQAFQEELARIQENEAISREEKIAAEMATTEAITEIRNQMYEEAERQREEEFQKQQELNNGIIAEEERVKQVQQQLLEERLGAFSGFFNGVGSLMEVAAKHNKGAAVAMKALSASEAAINSYLAFTKALASAAPPFNFILAAGTLAAGLAQQIKILSTPIPSAETGGRFIVPNSAGSDSGLMRVNQGEEVEVTPRGMTGFTRTQNITVQIEKQTIFDVVNDGIRGGDILIAAVNF